MILYYYLLKFSNHRGLYIIQTRHCQGPIILSTYRKIKNSKTTRSNFDFDTS